MSYDSFGVVCVIATPYENGMRSALFKMTRQINFVERSK